MQAKSMISTKGGRGRVGMRLLVAAAVALGVLPLMPATPAAADTLVPSLLKDINPGAANSDPAWFVERNREVFFVSHGDTATSGLWKTDGTEAGTVLVKAVNTGSLFVGGSAPSARLTLVGDTLYFAGRTSPTSTSSDRELWKSDGTEAGTVVVKDINPGTSSSAPRAFTAVGSTLFFTAETSTSGRELWKSDGTEAGTVMVKDINPGTASSNPGVAFSSAPEHFAVLGDELLFPASDGTSNTTAHGTELWKTDGTEAGTVMVKDINFCPTATSALNSNPQHLTLLGNKVLFSANNGGFCDGVGFGDGTELWETDGTAAGTVMVKDINPGTSSFGFGLSSLPKDFKLFGSFVLFSADDGSGTARELWKTDGTEAGTVLVKDIHPGTAPSNPINFTVAGAHAYFAATGDYTTGNELWKTDGTEAGTVLVKDINPGNGSIGSNPGGSGRLGAGYTNTGVVGTDVYFLADDGAHGTELWKTDGTEAGTVLAGDINPGNAGSSPELIAPALGTLFFSATDGTTGYEPYRLTPTGAPNQPPVAVDDAYTTPADTPLNVPAPGVLANDSDPDGDTLTAGSASEPANGSVVLNPDGSFTYTPDPGFTGADSFTYTASDGSLTSAPATVSITVGDAPPPDAAAPVADFDGDGSTDRSVYRPSNGMWFARGIIEVAWGTGEDVPVPADYDGDRDTDVAVFRPSTGEWFVQGSPVVRWGTTGDVPVPADYDNDGAADVAVFRPSTGEWFVQGQPVVRWGVGTDVPVPGDYDNDGAAEVAVFRPSTGEWFVQGQPVVRWGTNGDIPVPADYDNDGAAEVAVFRPSTGEWFVQGQSVLRWGVGTDVPVPGDYDADGDTDVAVYRPSTGQWFVPGSPVERWGIDDDIPLPLPYAIRSVFFP